MGEITRKTRGPDLDALADTVARAAENPGIAAISIDLTVKGEPTMPPEVLYDRLGRKRSPATLRSFRLGIAPGNKGKRYPAVALKDNEVSALLAACKNNPAGRRLRALMVLQFRSGLRISEALDLQLHDLDEEAGTVFVANGKGSKSRLVGMDGWAFEQIKPWLDERYKNYPDGPVFCIVAGKTKGQRWSASAARTDYHKAGARAGIRKRVHPHCMRHTMACGMTVEGQPIIYTSRQLGHTSVGTTAQYLLAVANDEVVKAVSLRPVPVLVAA